ncbi:MAG: ferritin-like domain-containing protein [Actinomycetota bacterium]|nr:ferritin-like domain-containing protein [Actinomycetota bacterium]
MIDHDPTRRELLGGGVATTAAVALAATAPSLLAPLSALAAPVGDGAVLASLLRVERVVVFAYERALATTALTPAVQQLLSSFLAHERAHVQALAANLTSLGSAVPAPLKDTAAFASELRQLRVGRSPPQLRNERQHVRSLIDLETVIARHYRYAIARLSAGKELSIASEIMANEAQHATILRELLSPGNVKRAVPSAFVAGKT